MNPSIKRVLEGVAILIIGGVIIAFTSAYFDIRSYNNRIEKIEQMNPKLSHVLKRFEISPDGEVGVNLDSFTYVKTAESKDKEIDELKKIVNGLRRENELLKINKAKQNGTR